MSNRTMSLFMLVMALVICVGAVGCKKKDDKVIIVQPDVGGDHYYSATIYGDFMDVQVNEASALYSYLKLAGPSPFLVGQGTLTAAATALGAHAYYDDEGGLWAMVPDKFLALGGDGFAALSVPLISTTYAPTVIAGMYNILSMDFDPDDGSLSADYGTLEIDAAGTWKIWWNLDGTTVPASNDDDGTWTDKGNGLVSVHSNGMGTNIGDIAIHPSGNGNILIMHYGASHPVYGSFYGMIVGLPQAAVTSGDFDGVYNGIHWEDTDFSEVTVSGTSVVVTAGPTMTFTYNSPWDGMIEVDTLAGYALATQDGLIVVVEYNTGMGDDNIILNVIRQ